MSEITVLGIFVADISFSGPKIPSIGETILGKKYNVGPGGKGCNQAIAIARLGGNTNFISKIGKDAYGELALKTLEKNKISTENINQDINQQTGVAGILVDQNTGKNAINVIVGAAFAFGWTPCIGPVLGSIIALSATEATISKGILLLSFYSLGLAIPFILSGYYMSRFLNSKKGFGKYYGTITKSGGAILLITGILITTNYIQVISYYILTTFPILAKVG